MSILYIVATPIGNLQDITFRAIEVLKTADIILCEDTRVTKRLLDHYEIRKPTLSYHTHSNILRQNDIVERLKNNQTLALVSDAGTPCIADPGADLIRHVRNECRVLIASGDLKIIPIPGPSAITTALSVAGVPCSDFIFYGFIPHKKGRLTMLREASISERTAVFYESPHRIMKTLEMLSDLTAQKTITICREMTKVFEEVVSGRIAEVMDYFKTHQDKIRGEFVVILSNSV